jgi:hypothetical protein
VFYSNFAMFRKGKMMDELHEVMFEMEQRLEIALDNMEYGTELSQDDVDVIRAACGKPNNKRNVLLQSVFDDFGNIFGSAK